MQKMEVKFINPCEVRMGSPYNICDIVISGEWVPPLPKIEWQDKMAFNPDKTILALVAWDINKKNEPGFCIYYLNIAKHEITKSNRYSGCCSSIEWSDCTNDFNVDIFI